MKCPVCGSEMEKGYLEFNKAAVFSKKRHTFLLLAGKDGVSLGSGTFGFAAFEAYICRDCKKIVFDYSNDDYQGES